MHDPSIALANFCGIFAVQIGDRNKCRQYPLAPGGVNHRKISLLSTKSCRQPLGRQLENPDTVLLTALLAGCGESPRAWGEVNSLIVATSQEQWDAIGEMVDSAIETRVLTVRPEKTFRVTHQVPAGQAWDMLQRFRQLLLVGTPDSPWMAAPLARAERESFNPPELFQVGDVWARGQSVTVLLLPSTGADGADELMAPLHELLDGQYRQWSRTQMYQSGPDSLLADTLWNEAGFTMLLPKVYQHRTVDSVHIFRNDNPTPTELIRQIAVTWRSPIPEELDQEELLAWRTELTEGYYIYDQVVDLDLAQTRRLQLGDLILEELRAVWSNPPDDLFPAGGPMILWSVPCPAQNRHYMIDAWLYAPGRDKYQYVLQLETILNTFRCRSEA